MKKIKQAEERERADGRQSQKNLFQEAFHPVTNEIKFHSILLREMLISDNADVFPKTPAPIFRPPQLG